MNVSRAPFLAAALALLAAAPASGAAPSATKTPPGQAKKRAASPKPAAAPRTAIADDTEDPAIWGAEYPLEYETYLKTVDMVSTRHGGSEPSPWTPTRAEDPRVTVTHSKIDADPRLKDIWAGYAFATEFREERGHAYMLVDQRNTRRVTEFKQAGACLNCHASVYVPFKRAGDGDLVKGFERVNAMPYGEATKLASHPVACIDCHDPATMALRVTRPAFMEGIRAYKASQGIAGYDVNAQASQAEMRAFVCGQCHVEYYFKGPEKRLTFPWSRGLQVEQIAGFYDEAKFSDWRHAKSGAPALKAQHPEFELWSQGIHARSAVTCVDCHMPEIAFKGARITDHQVNSPVLKLEAACGKCHAKWPAAELKARVEQIQGRTLELRDAALDAVVALTADIARAAAAGKADPELVTARYLQRRAQFMTDFVEAENSVGFHAPQEAARVLGLAADLARQGQLAVRDAAFKPSIAVVDVPPPPPPATSAAHAAATK
ncbi:MAG TPA: ammonia-forming cytochrome c nitrite reductase subunit c552 [Anaeromyxobacteraceae bacterium]|nr:ammonia-forming cytochrome c nitrite reductase subunit c552 [Anaeromyxobacteraceae bacterium]